MESNRSLRTKSSRKQQTRELKPSILIVCEGECTEPRYFERFNASNAVIKIHGVGKNTKSLIADAIKIRKQTGPYDQVWVVFDLDSFSKGHFDNAIKIAEKEGIRVAYSNEAFELWYMLHFDHLQSAISRSLYIEILKSKTKSEIYEERLINLRLAKSISRDCHQKCGTSSSGTSRSPLEPFQ